MDEAILKNGVNLIDTAEQYPIPSGESAQEGDCERVIGKWMKDRKVPRENVVIATKITGGRCENTQKHFNFYKIIFSFFFSKNHSFLERENLFTCFLE